MNHVNSLLLYSKYIHQVRLRVLCVSFSHGQRFNNLVIESGVF